VSQRTLILVKPDGVQRSIIGDVISRIERKGLKVIALELRTIDTDTAHAHYAEHAERPFFGELVDFITSGPLVAIVRALAGTTDPVKAAPGTIRGDYALQVSQNIVHGSDSPESAEREIKIFFPELV
jgi:nucleoside-diphosphate kinase